jgi:hypothetical protein
VGKEDGLLLKEQLATGKLYRNIKMTNYSGASALWRCIG